MAKLKAGRLVFSNTEFIQQNRTLRNELDLISEKVKMGFNEKAHSLLKTENTYDYHHSKSCNGELRYIDYGMNKGKFECLVCRVIKSNPNFQLISSEVKLANYENNSQKILEEIQQSQDFSIEKDIELIEYSRHILSNLYRMFVDDIEEPSETTEENIKQAKEIMKKLKGRYSNLITLLDLAGKHEVNLIKNSFEVKKINDEWNLTKSSRTRTFENIDVSQLSDIEEMFYRQINFKNILKMVKLEINEPLKESNKTAEKLTKKDFMKFNKNADNKLQYAIDLEQQEIQGRLEHEHRELEHKIKMKQDKIYAIKYNHKILNKEYYKSYEYSDTKRVIFNDFIARQEIAQKEIDQYLQGNQLHEFGKVGIMINQFTKYCDKIVKGIQQDLEHEARELDEEIRLVTMELSIYLNVKPNTEWYEPTQKKIPILQDQLSLLQETKEIIKVGII